MRNRYAYLTGLLLFTQLIVAQNISINADGSAPDGSAMLDVVATDKGVLIPRMTQAQRTGIANPATSLIVYQTDGDAGFYFNAGIPSTPSWVKLASENDIGEPVAIQDTDGDTKLDVEGSGDEDQISIEVAGTEYFRIDTVNNGGNSPTPRLQFLNNGSNILIGGNAGSSISNTGGNGVRNVIIGENSGNGTTDYSNVFIGVDVATTNGSAQNVAIGNQAARLGLNRSVAIGHDAGQNGGLDFSVAIGFNAAPSVTDANQSVMIGNNTGANLTSGDHNTLVGANAGSALTIGSGNIFLGKDAGANQTGDNKLFIENSNVSTPLIYGDFTEDSLVINGVLSLDSARDGSGYTLPGSRGSNGQVLTSDGSGRVNWVNVASGNTLDAAYDQGGSGSGRVITADNGALRVAGTDGLMVTGTFGSGSTVGVSGSGQRLFFNPRTGSFRAGTVTSTHWDNSNLGANSIALGYNTTASGTASTAIGSTNNASASNSMVLGYNSNASSTQAMAIGSNVNASGLSAIAMGSGSTASGNYSNTLGFGVLSKSQGEVALGVNNTDYTPNSTSSFNSNDRLLVVGNGSSSSNRSDAFTIYKSGKTYINNTLTLSNGTDSITFPNIDGNANEVLQTDGSGNVSWAAVSSGDTLDLIQSIEKDSWAIIEDEISGSDDVFRFYQNNKIMMTLDSGKIIPSTGNGGIFIGSGAGDNESSTIKYNVFIGSQAGSANTSGTGVFIGKSAGASQTTGRDNTFIGSRAGNSMIGGNYNVALGTFALRSATFSYRSTAIGYFALNSHTSGNVNTVVGAGSLENLITGSSNTALGYNSGNDLSSGSNNLLLGSSSAQEFTSGNGNVALGQEAGAGILSGNYNVFIGQQSGTHSTDISSQSSVIKIGYQSGMNDSTDNKLYIENSSSSTPLIYGDFANDSLKVYGTLSVGDKFTFPATDGTNGQVLQTDGSGNISWADAGDDLGSHSATTRIQLNGNKISNDGDNEGLSIWNDGRIVGTPADTVAGNIAFLAKGDFQTAKQGMGYYFSGTQIGITGNNSNSGDMRFRTAATNRMIITSGGQVGVNTTSIPTGYIMHINGLTRINNLNINNNYTLPTVDGDANYVLQTDGSGNVSWAEIIATSADTARVLADVDGNTKIQVEESTNEDLIRFDVAGTEVMRIDDFSRINVPNTRASLFIGNQAGANINAGTNNSFIGYEAGENNSNGSNNTYVGYQAGKAAGFDSRNTFIGSSSGLANNGGIDNTFLGSNTGSSNTTGDRNTFIGQSSGQSNNGDDNIFIGYNAGALQTAANDLLFIENSNSNTPLIYGNFATDSLIFNAATKISSNTSGDAQLIIEADTDDNDNSDNPSISFFQDGGSNQGFIGLEGEDEQTITGGQDNSLILGTFHNDRVQLFTNGIARLTVDNGSNNVGIGTSSPGWDLEIRDSTGNGSLHLASDDPGSDAYMDFENTISEFTLRNYGGNGKFVIESDHGGGNEIMVMEPEGNVGIGTSSPDSLLHVDGGARIDHLNINGYYTLPTSNGNGVLSNDGSGNLSWASISGADNLGNHTAATNINLDGNYLSGDGTSKGLHVDTDGDVTIGANTGFNRFSVYDTNDLDISFLSRKGQTSMDFYSYGNSTQGNEIIFRKGRGELSSSASVNFNDRIVEFKSSPYDGSSSFVSSFMTVRVGGAPSAGIVPTQIEFSTVDNTGNTDERMVIEPNGYVAMGQSYANYPLQLNTSNNGVILGITDENKSGNLTHAMLINNNNAIFQMKDSTASLPVYLNTSGDSWLTGGNVGIGTSSPGNLLSIYNNSGPAYFDVKGTGDVNSFSGFTLGSDEATDKSWTFLHRKTSMELNNFAFEFFDGSSWSQKLVIEPAGFVGIGDGNIDPTSRLDVEGSIEIDGASGGTAGDDSFYFGNPDTDGSWRIRRDGNDLSFERKESGFWVIKVKMNP